MSEALRAALFPDDGEKTYAIIDGASCEELLDKLYELQPEFVCLYAGELESDIEEVAPYLIELLPDHPFTDWLFSNCLGKNWGIFARSSADFRTLRKHFRTILLVKDPEGKTLYFRYYDPRVLSIYLPTTNAKERAIVFGPINGYYCESEKDGFVELGQNDWELTKRLLFPFNLEHAS